MGSFYKNRTFYNSCKIAKLKLFFEKGYKTNPSNYRPITLAALISKIIEKVINEKANSFLSNNEILYHYQSGFWKNYLTDSCLTLLHDKILKCFDKGLMIGIWYNWPWYTIEKIECYWFLKSYYWLVQIIPFKSIV